MAEKMQVTIYKIDNENTIFDDTKNIIDPLRKRIIKNGYKRQTLKTNLKAGYTIELLYSSYPSNPKWKDFFVGVAEKEQPILKISKGRNESFIMLIYNETTENLYAITGGTGYHQIQEYIEDDFGVDIISRIISKDAKTIKSVKEMSIMGGVLGQTKYFRKDYNLIENDSFGKIYQELKSGITKNSLRKYFGFSTEDLKKNSSCIAKSSFKISKAIDFNQLFKIIEGCEDIYNDKNLKQVQINNVNKIDRRNKDLIQKLKNELLHQLWLRFNGEDNYIDFDLCHKDYDKYLTASYYVVKKNYSKNSFFDDETIEELYNVDQILDKLHQLEIYEDENAFKELIPNLKIFSYVDEDQTNSETNGFLIQHLFGDVQFIDDKYFFIDNQWYIIHDSFIDELNTSCQHFVKENNINGLDKFKWDYFAEESENDYNAKYIANDPAADKVIVLDKITPDYIEPCDILMWDDDKIYFYHVKAGFNNTMRDLCSQVFISANKIKQDVNSGYNYIGMIYDNLKKKKNSSDSYFKKAGNQIANISKEDFIDLFRNRIPVFVLSVLDTNKAERDIINNISTFRSNIAKFSLQDLFKVMKGIDVELKITQIWQK